MRRSTWIAQYLAAVRTLLVLTVLLGVAYPLLVTLLARLPGLRDQADGSLVRDAAGRVVGSALIGQQFTDRAGNPLPQYVQSRPSAAGAGYDPTATGASNLGPESVVDVLPDPARPADPGRPSLLTQVCARSAAVARLDGVDGARPFCTHDTGAGGGAVGAVLAVYHRDGLTGSVTRAVSVNQACPATPFVASYAGVPVECARFGQDYGGGVVTPIRGSAPSEPAVPADAVTAGGSGLDPAVSPAYARLQAARVAAARGVGVGAVLALVAKDTVAPTLGFLGEPTVNVVLLDLDLDRLYPVRAPAGS